MRLFEDWNWTISKELEDVMGDAKEVHINMEHARWIDSEGIRTLCAWVRSGKRITLKYPPKVYFEIIELLELADFLKDVRTVVKD